MRDVNLRQLRYFVAVAEELSFSRAAERLAMSQPPLSRQIAALEADVGSALILRKPRGIGLTAAGEVLLLRARELLRDSEQALHHAKLADRGELGLLNIGGAGLVLFKVVSSFVKPFIHRFPDVKVNVLPMHKIEQIHALKRQRIDLGFARSFHGSEDLILRVIASEPLVVAVSTEHPLAQMAQVDLLQIAKDRLVLYPSNERHGFADDMIQVCQEAGFTPEDPQMVNDLLAALTYVSCGFGVSILPRSVLNLPMAQIRYLPIVPPSPVSAVSYAHRADPISSTLRCFLNFIEDRRYGEEGDESLTGRGSAGPS